MMVSITVEILKVKVIDHWHCYRDGQKLMKVFSLDRVVLCTLFESNKRMMVLLVFK